MRLSQFITENTPAIISDWEGFAKTLTPAADNMSDLQLKDHIAEILEFIAQDIETPQTSAEQVQKSQGERDTPLKKNTAAETHGGLRHGSGFDIVQMVSEYRALRGSIIKLWSAYKEVLSAEDMLDLTRFNEAIDQALAESVVRFMEKVDYSKDLLLGVLGHDIRSPLGTIQMSAHLMPKVGVLNEKQTTLATQIDSCSGRVNRIVTDLLDLTRARMGTGLPVRAEPMDMVVLAYEIVSEFRTMFPGSEILLQVSGEGTGEWDGTRLGQVLTNLIGNAIQYGAKGAPIEVTVKGEAQEVTLSVKNDGDPIPSDRLATLFDSFTRGEVGRSDTDTPNLGLGLFITREIILSHKGSLQVTSTAKDGTIFTARLPRNRKGE